MVSDRVSLKTFLLSSLALLVFISLVWEFDMALPKKVLQVLSIVIILMIICEIAARPGAEWKHNNVCESGDSTKREICQRCAKQTKSPIVYPMCCNEEDEVHNWCYRYTNYGKMA